LHCTHSTAAATATLSMTMPTTEKPLESALIATTDSTESTEQAVAVNGSTPKATTAMNMTPTRPSTSYATDPSQTPIASAKRPAAKRSSSSLQLSNGNGNGSTRTLTDNPEEEPLSPMHGVKPVENCRRLPQVAEIADEKIAKEDELFSPVAHSLHTATENHTSVDTDHDASDDESMGRPEQPHADTDEFNPWQFIQSLPPYQTVQHQCPAVTLPPLQDPHKKTLVLDLDETLVHCSIEEPDPESQPPDLEFPVQFHGTSYTVYVRLRPHLEKFLKQVSQKFEVVCFTASQKVYADALLNRIDPGA